jgi:hypothetical protein
LFKIIYLQAEVVLPKSGRNLADYAAVFSLNTVKDPAEEESLSACAQTVIYVNPQAGDQTAMTRRFTDSARKPLPRAVAGPENEYIVIGRSVDIDLVRFPVLRFRCRNTPNTIFPIRYRGTTANHQASHSNRVKWWSSSDRSGYSSHTTCLV